MKRPVKRGIEGQIPPADLLVHDGPNLPRPSIGRISAALPADFVREADSYGPVPLRRNAHAGTDVAADIIPALTVLSGSKNVKPGLEPVIEAMSDLDGFVQLVVRGKRAVIGGFGTLKREIGMQLHHSVARLQDRKSTRLNSSHVSISYAVFCLKKKTRSSLQYASRVFY